tara:strand:+ start:215 stop:463 length:249 start_codon:yes stop_codon:yes gene_type:complete
MLESLQKSGTTRNWRTMSIRPAVISTIASAKEKVVARLMATTMPAWLNKEAFSNHAATMSRVIGLAERIAIGGTKTQKEWPT